MFLLIVARNNGGVKIKTDLITLLGILTITINRYFPKGNVRTGQKKPMRGTSLINFTKKITLPYKL
jgi:hypothetical protein